MKDRKCLQELPTPGFSLEKITMKDDAGHVTGISFSITDPEGKELCHCNTQEAAQEFYSTLTLK
jgi:hypothetical protein